VTGRHNDRTVFSKQWIQIVCPLFYPQTKVEEKLLGAWNGRIYQRLQRLTSPAIHFAKQILPNPENRPAKVVYQKHHHAASLACSSTSLSASRAPSETGSSLLQPQLHSTTGRYTYAYIRKPADESDIFLDNRALTELKLSVKIKHFSGG
jgi:hypothetical protein